MATKPPEYKTLTINNFGGRLTRYANGDINSGYCNITNTQGANPFSNPGQLTWQEAPIQIDSAGSVITDLIMCGKERVESGISYVYCVGHTGRVYKIQVNNPATYNSNYDNPVLLTTLVTNSPTFKYGGFIEFFDATPHIYIGSDVGLTRLNFDGTNETFIGVLGSWTQNVPRPLKQFVGNLYAGNGTNIAEFGGASLIINSYTKLSPGFPGNTQVRDFDLSSDGNYLQSIVTELALSDQTLTTQDTTIATSSNSYLYQWNGSDVATTSLTIFPAFSLTANKTFGQYEYTFGYSIAGSSVFNPTQIILFPNLSISPSPNGVLGNGNIVSWGTSEFYQGFLRFIVYLYGTFDSDNSAVGWWRQVAQAATGTEKDVIRSPFSLLVSQYGLGASTNGYTGSLYSVSKVYFSTLETSATTTKYKFYKFYTVSAGISTATPGVYQTQTQLFPKKIKPIAVRVYGSPWIANNSFTIDLIGSAGTPIAGGSKTLSIGSGLAIGNDYAWYNPNAGSTYALGLSITNVGTANNTINKVEIDYTDYGQ